ncbi:olfactory receptor 51I2-like [Brachyhypopomus gauderio]|uniref:olfactory receptor 51I2-like n=1 Tax=Brachyhypopomus gauderio TaxID=698409 RepID=UPI00404109AE
MMENYSGNIMFVLQGLNDTRTNKQIYFGFGLLIYLFTLFANSTLVITIALDKMLHEPMYLFVCNLFVNGIYGVSAVYPKILADLIVDSPVISYTGCITQIFIIYSYAFCEFTCLTVMAYDRYVAICKPLEYHTIMTNQMVGKLLICTWTYAFIETLVGIGLTIRLTLCGKNIEKPYCSNWEVVKLSCTDVTVNNLYGYYLIISHFSQAMFVIVSYIQIIRAALRSKTERIKFMQTCLPHLITLMNFALSMLFDALYSRYGKSNGPQAVRDIWSMEYLVVPPLLNPLIYGLKVTQIRHSFLKLCGYKLKALRQR